MDSRKRARPDSNGAGVGAGASKHAKEADSALGSKTKPCTKFFSTAGCPFGEGCHFQHNVPGGFNAAAQKVNLGSLAPAPPRNQMISAAPAPSSVPAAKTRMCNKYNTAEGCRFGEKCHFAHGERELGKPVLPSYDNGPSGFLAPGRLPSRFEPPPPAATSFGASATAKISVDGSLAGGIIGKGGVNTKHIQRITGAKLFIKEHESDATQKNIELEGTFDQIKHASAMVKDLIMSLSATPSFLGATPSFPVKPAFVAGPGGQGSNFKTKLCENFTKGSCTFGERCHFAHGESELRKAAP